MNSLEHAEEYIRKAELRKRAPKMLDALRLIRFAVRSDHESSQQRAENVLKLCESALKGTEDL